ELLADCNKTTGHGKGSALHSILFEILFPRLIERKHDGTTRTALHRYDLEWRSNHLRHHHAFAGFLFGDANGAVRVARDIDAEATSVALSEEGRNRDARFEEFVIQLWQIRVKLYQLSVSVCVAKDRDERMSD